MGQIKKLVTTKTINIVAGVKKFTVQRLEEKMGELPVETELSKKIMAIFEEGKSKPELLDDETSPILDLLDIDKKTVGSPFHIDPIHCKVFIHGEEVDAFFAKKIVQLHDEHKPFEYLVNFYKRFEKNSNPKAKEELFLFLAHNGLPITKEGYFIGYKTVRADYYSSYNYTPGGKDNVLNMPGTWVEFDRSKVDPNRNQTCSHGLHVANYNYAVRHYGSPKCLTLLVDPADVVTVPSDYNNQKMRVCAYYVLEDCKGEYKENFLDLNVELPSRENAVVTSVTEEVPEITVVRKTFLKSYINSTGSIWTYKRKNGKGKNLNLEYIDSKTGATFKVYVSVGVPDKWKENSAEIIYQSNIVTQIESAPKVEEAQTSMVVPETPKNESKKLKDVVSAAIGDKDGKGKKTEKVKKEKADPKRTALKKTLASVFDPKTKIDASGKVAKKKSIASKNSKKKK